MEFGDLGDSFAMQNTVFSAATGIERSVWLEVPGNLYRMEGNGAALSEVRDGYCKYSDVESGATVTCSFTADRDGFVCVRLDFPKRNDLTIRINGADVYHEDMSLPQMMAVGDVKQGDVISIEANCKAGENGTLSVEGAMLAEDVFQQGYEILSASTLELTTFRNTLVEGTISCDQDGLLYTSIPQNGNWKALVDGKPTEIQLVGDCMVAVPLTQGNHQVTFVYHNAAFSLGWKISLGCVLVFGLLAWVQRKRGRRREYQV